MREQLPFLVAAIHYAEYAGEIVYILATDKSVKAKDVFDRNAKELQNLGIKSHHLIVNCEEDNGNKKHCDKGNRLIAALQAAAFNKARSLKAELFWSLESDILPTAKTLRTSLDSLAWDKGFYDVVMCTYGNRGFLGGYGTPQQAICPDVYPEERKLTEGIKKRLEKKKKREEELSRLQQKYTDEDHKSWVQLDEDIAKCPPLGNMFYLQSLGWKPRGWFENAYPGVGLGALLPTRWAGMGCTLLSKRALALAEFTGYNGAGTQDLHLGWKCWQNNGLRLAVTSHALCHHVKKVVDEDGKPVLKDGVEQVIVYFATHEIMGSQQGHLRLRDVPFNEFVAEG